MNNKYNDPFTNSRPRNKKIIIADNLKRTNRETTNFNNVELGIAEKARIEWGYDDMSSFLRALATNTLEPPELKIPEINKEIAEKLNTAFSEVTLVINEIDKNQALTKEQNIKITLQNLFTLMDLLSLVRQELYGNLDKKTLFDFTIHTFTTDEMRNMMATMLEKRHD
jgi:hypothetical protein